MHRLARISLVAALSAPFVSVSLFAQATSQTPSTLPAPPAGQSAPVPTGQTTPSAGGQTGGQSTPASTIPATTGDGSGRKPLPGADPQPLPPVDSAHVDTGRPLNTKPADSIPQPGEALDPHIKAGSEEDVNAIGTRNIGGRGLGNWYGTNWEISVGKQYSMEIEKSAHLVTDPVVVEYVNRIGQNLVKNSDAKVPFTIKVLDSDEINAMALPGGFFYVNSGLILNCDEEAELAGVMAHEISHVVAHHAARQQTKMNYAQIASIPVMILTEGTWTGYGIYEATQIAIPLTFLQFSRADEAEADYLGVQYMYKAGYDPQAFVTLFEKLTALEKHKPGALSKAFSDHPQTPDRIANTEDEIATILPARPEYIVTTSEFDDVKARLARIENKRKINGKGNDGKPTLRRAGSSTSSDPNSTNQTSDSDQPTLGKRKQ